MEFLRCGLSNRGCKRAEHVIVMAALGLGVLVAQPRVVYAEASRAELQAARQQFRDAIELEAAGDWTGALSKFEKVARVKTTPQVRFHIARCQEHLGNLLEALGAYRWAAHEAGTNPKAQEVLKEASEGVERVQALIPKLVIKRGPGTETSSVSLDGVALGSTSFSKPVPVNPGAHTLSFRALNGEQQRVVVEVEQGKTKEVLLKGPAESKHVASPEHQQVSVPSNAPEKSSPDQSSSASPPSNVWPWVLVGVGGASLVASGVFYGLRASTISEHDDGCVDNVCPASLEDSGASGKTYTTLGNVSLGVGIIAVGAGLTWMLAGGSETAHQNAQTASPTKRSFAWTVDAHPHGAQASIKGTF